MPSITRIGAPNRYLGGGGGRNRGAGASLGSSAPSKGKSAGLPHLLKEAWPFLRPQRVLLLFGLVLMAINRLAGLVLPASTKFLVDNVVGKREVHLLVPLALAIMGATAIQGVTSFTLTQLLSKAAQRMIADLRKQVQGHIGRLSISFHDTNKTGNLVARIMSDVEGLRNLMGTGLVELVGSLMTASFALIVLLRISVFMTAVAFAILVAFGLALEQSDWHHTSDLSRALQAERRGDGPAHRVAGRNSRGEGLPRRTAGRECFRRGRATAARKHLEDADGDFGDELVVDRALWRGERVDPLSRHHAHSGRNHDAGHFSDLCRVFGDAHCAGVCRS